jgi:hypothetical protein
MEISGKKNWLSEARDRGGAYLAPRQRADGSFGSSIWDYYKTLTALQVCGLTKEANALCSWIRANALTPQGDFGPRDEADEPRAYIYINSWIILGAHRLGRFDVSQRAIDFLIGFRDPESGGFYSHPTQRDADTKQDLIYTGFAGLAALYTGRIDVARGVGRWLNTLRELQPEFPKKLYTICSRAHGLYTTVDPSEELRYVVLSDAKRDQFFFQPGVAAGFLARLYEATGETQWLDLAQEYMRFVEAADDYLFHLVRAGKVGWAAAVLYTITSDRKYKEIARRIGSNLIACQAETGYWTVLQGSEPSDEVTAEMVVWLDEIDQGIGNG